MAFYDCCEYGNMMTETDDGDDIYPDLCDCVCHTEEDFEYEEC